MEKKRYLKYFGSFFVNWVVICIVLVCGAQAGRDTLIIQTWGGSADEAIRKAFVEPFMKETGIKTKTVVMGGELFGKLGAMQKSKNIEFDLMMGIPLIDNENFYKNGWLGEVDYSVVTNTKDLVEGSVQKWGVGTLFEGYCLVYNTNAFPPGKEPKSWKDFFDVEKFPGSRAIPNWGGPVENLTVALWADGVAPDDCFPMDLDRAFKMMDKIKPHVKVWYTSGAQLVQILQEEEVVMALSTDGRAKEAIKNGAPIKIEWNQGYYFLTYNSVINNSPMHDALMQYLNFWNRPKQQAIYMKLTGYSTTNTKAIEYIDPEARKEYISHPDILNKMVNYDLIKNVSWKAKNREMVAEKWTYWLAK